MKGKRILSMLLVMTMIFSIVGNDISTVYAADVSGEVAEVTTEATTEVTTEATTEASTEATTEATTEAESVATTEEVEETSGDLTWSIDSEGCLLIEGTGDYEQDEYGYPAWTAYARDIKTAVVKVKNITTTFNMFYGCTNLTSVDLTALYTSEVTNMGGMFFGCSSLTNIDVSKFNTDNVTDMTGMFDRCSSLKIIDLSKFNTSKVTSIYEMFRGCSALTSINVNGWNTGNVTDMGDMFNGCSALTSIELGSFDTSNVTDMRYMFSDCSALTSIDLSSFNTSKVTDMNYMFAMFNKVSSLTSIVLSSKFDTSNVTRMEGMFGDCSALTSIDLTSFDTGNIKSMSFMFAGCSSLTRIDLSSSFDTSSVTRMEGMFWGCSSLTSIDLSSFNTNKVTNMLCMFNECSSLESIDLSSFDTSEVTDMSDMFSGCSALTSITLSSSFDTSEVTDMSGMFIRCSSLTSIDLSSSFNTSKVTEMSSMFAGCSALISIDVSEFNTSKVENMTCMFYNCSSLTSIDLSSFNTSNLKNMGLMLSDCSALISIKLPKTKLTFDIPYTDKNSDAINWKDEDNKIYISGPVSGSLEKNVVLTRIEEEPAKALSSCTEKATEIILDDSEIHANNDIIKAYYSEMGHDNKGTGHLYKVMVPANTSAIVNYSAVQSNTPGKIIACHTFDDSFSSSLSSSNISTTADSNLSQNGRNILVNTTGEAKQYYIWIHTISMYSPLETTDDIVLSVNTIDMVNSLIDSATPLEAEVKYSGTSSDKQYLGNPNSDSTQFSGAGQLFKIDVNPGQSMNITSNKRVYIKDTDTEILRERNGLCNKSDSIKTFYVWVSTTDAKENFNVTANVVGDASNILDKAAKISLSKDGIVAIDKENTKNYVAFTYSTEDSGVLDGYLYKVEGEGIFKVGISPLNEDEINEAYAGVLILNDKGEVVTGHRDVILNGMFPGTPIAINTAEDGGTHYIFVARGSSPDAKDYEWSIGLDAYSDITTAGAKTLKLDTKYTVASSDPKSERYYNYTSKDFYMYKINIAAGEQVKVDFTQDKSGITAGYTGVGYIYDAEGNIIDQCPSFDDTFSLKATNETEAVKDYYVGFYYFGEEVYGIDCWSITPSTCDAWVDDELSHNNHIIEIGKDKTFDLSALVKLGFKVSKLKTESITNATISGNNLTITEPKTVVKYDYVVGDKTYNMQFVPYQSATGEETPAGNVTAVEEVVEDKELGGTKVVSITVNDEGKVLGKVAETTITVDDNKVVVVENKEADGSTVKSATVDVIQNTISSDAINKGIEVASDKINEYKVDGQKASISTINATFKKSTKSNIDKTVFTKLKDAGVDLEISKVDEADKVLYSWNFEAEKISDISITVNPVLTVYSAEDTYDKQDTIEGLTEDGAKNLILAFDHSGDLPGKATVKVAVDSKYTEGTELYFYYFNETTNKLEFLQKATVAKGYVDVELLHCSDYVLTDEQVQVQLPITGMEFTVGKVSLVEGDSKTLVVDVKPTTATNKTFNWTSNHSDIVSVDNTGKIIAKKAGKATIKAAATDGSEKYAECEVTVASKTISVTKVTISSTSETITVGNTKTLTATVSPLTATNKAVEWKSSNATVAKVDANGKITAVSEGKTTITCTAKDGSGKSATCTVTVKAEPVAPVPVTPAVNTTYRTHVQSYGWQPSVANGAISGTSGESKRLEAIDIRVAGNDNLGVEYTTHVQGYGWLPWVSNGELSGTEGESKRLEAIEIKLTGADKDKYDIYYCVHAQSYGWLNWAKNGESAGTAGYSKRLEAIKIVVVKKGEAAPANIGTNNSAYISKDGSSTAVVGGDANTSIMYKTHVQSYGWQAWKYNGATSGTVGKSKRLEGININVVNKSVAGGIKYSTHVQSYGWQDWAYDGAMSGTSGESKRLEAIKIELTGQMKEQYDVYYRVHTQTYGWLDWAKNGEEAGTAGLSRRLEGIDIILVPKGGQAPGSTARPFIKK